MVPEGEADRVRIDKWLWAARFYKTRALSAEAVEAGKVQVNGERVKPAKALKRGDSLTVRNGPFTWAITVRVLGDRRGSAIEAARLYEESVESRKARDETAAINRFLADGVAEWGPAAQINRVATTPRASGLSLESVVRRACGEAVAEHAAEPDLLRRTDPGTRRAAHRG
jgi:ribosome-associated heat shock protein Hsp15